MTQPKSVADWLYGAPAVADYLGVSERQARYLMDRGTLPSFHVNGKVCSTRSDCDTMIADRRAAAAREARAAAGKVEA